MQTLSHQKTNPDVPATMLWPSENFTPLKRAEDDNPPQRNSAHEHHVTRYPDASGSNNQPERALGNNLRKSVHQNPPRVPKQVAGTEHTATVEWEGVVLETTDHEFECKLKVIKGSDVNFDEFATFSIDLVPEEDRELCQIGAIFRLVIGVKPIDGTEKPYSRLVFRRLPAWKQKDMDAAFSDLKRAIDNIEWADESAT